MLDFFLSYLLIYTYLVLFFATLFSGYLLFIPVWAIIIAAGAFAAQGYLDMNYVLISSFIWYMIWNISIYLLSFRYWKKSIVKFRFGKIIESAKFAWLEEYFKNNSTKTILTTRFLVTWLNSFINILSGFAKIGYKKFVILNIIGEIIHVYIFAYIGYYLWDEWEFVISIIEYIAIIIFLIIALLLVVRYTTQNKTTKKL